MNNLFTFSTCCTGYLIHYCGDVTGQVSFGGCNYKDTILTTIIQLGQEFIDFSTLPHITHIIPTRNKASNSSKHSIVGEFFLAKTTNNEDKIIIIINSSF